MFNYAIAKSRTTQTSGTFHDDLGGGHHMTTGATLYANGVLVAFTTVETFTFLLGFTGGVKVEGIDINGNIVFSSACHYFVVHGLLLGLGCSTHRWTEIVDDAAAERIVELKVHHFCVPRTNPLKRLGEVGRGAKL